MIWPRRSPRSDVIWPRLAAAGLLLGTALGPAAAAPAEREQPESPAAPDRLVVAPGGLVRWTGDGIASCSMDGTSWRPREGACWYPIDLMRQGREIELERHRMGDLERATIRLGDYPYPTQRLQVEPEMVSPPAAQLERIRRESARVAELWDLGGAPTFDLPLGWPLESRPEPKSFGARRIFNEQPRDPHTGIDLPAPKGAPVLAAASGRVAIADEHYFAGRCVFLDHGDDLVTMYFHLDRLDVRDGDTVERGQVIGTVGATGRATGPHLHFGVRWHGARIDPTILFGDPGRVPDVAELGSD